MRQLRVALAAVLKPVTPLSRLNSFGLGLMVASAVVLWPAEGGKQAPYASTLNLVGTLLFTWPWKYNRRVDEPGLFSKRQTIAVGVLMCSGFAVVFASLAIVSWQLWRFFDNKGPEPTFSMAWFGGGLGLVLASIASSVYVRVKKALSVEGIS